MSPERNRFFEDRTGASEVLGVILLVGIVFLGAWLVVVFGSSAIDQVQGQNQVEEAKLSMQEVDSRLRTLSELNDVPRVRFRLGNLDPGQVRTRRGGWINVTVNENPTCSVNHTLGSIRWEGENGDRMAYQAGGVFRSSRNGASSLIAAPDVAYRGGTIDITLVNVSGRVAESYNEAVVDVPSSRRMTNENRETLLGGSCVRPDNITMRINSDYYTAWGSYLESETGLDAQVDDNKRTVEVFFPQSSLSDTVNDTRNNVVNLSEDPSGDPVADYMSSVNVQNNTISIDKGVSNIYTVSIVPLNRQDLDIGRIENLTDARNVQRPPVDVVFTMDVSGSMNNYDGDSTTRSEEAQSAARSFLPELNASFDRAGVVEYDQGTELRTTDDGLYLSTLFPGDGDASAPANSVNETIEDIPDIPSGGTHIWEGVEASNVMLGLSSNQTRDRIVVLLTDGKNDNCYSNGNYDAVQCSDHNQWTREAAREAAEQGITIYTIGYGDESDVADGLLEDVADITGGNFTLAENSDELDDAFDAIAEDITTTRQIARAPITTNFTSGGGQGHSPNIAGDTDSITADTSGDETYLNINDPTAPSVFSHTFSLRGGEEVIINASWYECDQGDQDNDGLSGWVGTDQFRTHNGRAFQVVRCNDLIQTSSDVLDDENTSVYGNGANVSHLVEENSSWWQTNMSDELEPYLDADNNLTLESNQVIVVFEFPSWGTDASNRLALLYEIGRSEEEAQPRDVINFRIRNAFLAEPT